MKQNPYLTLHNSKWMYTLKLRHKTIKLLEENMGKNFMILDLAKLSWMLHKKHRQQKQKQANRPASNLAFIAKENTQQNEKTTYKTGKVPANLTSYKRLVSGINKELQQEKQSNLKVSKRS